MDRRVAIATAVAATSTLVVGTVAAAAAGGLPILGFDGDPPTATPSTLVVTQVEQVIDQVVVVTSTTAGPAVDPVAIDPADTTAATVIEGDGGPERPRPQYSSAGTTVAAAPVPAGTSGWDDDGDDEGDDEGDDDHDVVASTVPSGTVAVVTATTKPAPATTTPAASPTTAAPVPVVVAPTTAAPTTVATTVPATTTTVRPAGVPADWPASKPIPPMPAGCRNGQLEDNGVWNCQN